MHATSSPGGRVGRIGAVVILIGATWIGGAAGVAAAAPGDPGTVSGRVVDVDGDPVAGICVNVEPGGQGATSQVDGSYVIGGVDPGDHVVQFFDCNASPTFTTRWNLNRDQRSQADTVTVPVGAGVTLSDNTLVRGVAVSGTVTAQDGTPLEGVNVFVNPYDGSGPSAGAVTAADGTYRTGPLPDGEYRVQIDDPDDEYATEFWQDHAVFADADRVQLSSAGGTERPGVDAALALGASISGTVTGEGQPLAGICVNANTPASNGGWNGVSGAQTASDGTYTLAGLAPGIDLRIQFYDCTSTPSYVEQWYDGQPDFASSSSVVLSPDEVRSGVDAQLATGTRVAGTVTDAAGNPLPDIDVNVNPDGPGQGGYGRTDSSGNYLTSPVRQGRYRVQFRDNAGTWASEYWDDQPTFNTATLLEVTAGDIPQRNGIDAELSAASSISGTVTDTEGNPVPGACIAVATDTPNGPDGVGGAQADNDGNYLVTGLPALTVKVRAEDCGRVGPYTAQWWPAANSYAEATPITLVAGQQRPGVDFELPPAGTISGRVTDSSGQPIAGICVQAATSDRFGALVTTDAAGTYQLVLGDGGDYTVQFVDCRSQPVYAGRTVGPVSVTPGQAITGVDTLLLPGAVATVSGTVRNGDGVAVTGACVVAYLANQYALFGQVLDDGTFTITGVPSGTYAIAFVGCGDGGEPSAVVPHPVDPNRTYQAQWWQGVDLSLVGTGEGGPDPIAQGATLVAVPAGGVLTGFDQCFGCVPPPTTTTTTTPATTTTPWQVTVTITGQARRPGSITLTFASSGVLATSGAQGNAQAAATLTYTATCTSATAVTATITRTASPLTLTGVDDRATYTCVVSASVDGRVVGLSASVVVGPLTSGSLPATGADGTATAWAAAFMTLGGVCILLAVRRPRSASR